LLNLLAGTLRPGAGRIRFGGRDITGLPVHRRAQMGISRSYQVVNLFAGLTCEQVARLAVQRDMTVRDWFSAQGGRAVQVRAHALLGNAGLAELAAEETVNLSHGLQKHLEIALALANDAKLLLLDEPMAGMAMHERIDLARKIRTLAGERTIVFVEHDIDMVMSLADTVTVLHHGSIVAEGTPAEVRADATTQKVYLRGHA
jgi:branched-chain amino acid transport system ATP-binding protein